MFFGIIVLFLIVIAIPSAYALEFSISLPDTEIDETAGEEFIIDITIPSAVKASVFNLDWETMSPSGNEGSGTWGWDYTVTGTGDGDPDATTMSKSFSSQHFAENGEYTISVSIQEDETETVKELTFTYIKSAQPNLNPKITSPVDNITIEPNSNISLSGTDDGLSAGDPFVTYTWFIMQDNETIQETSDNSLDGITVLFEDEDTYEIVLQAKVQFGVSNGTPLYLIIKDTHTIVVLIDTGTGGETIKKSSGGCNDCTPPTLGMDNKAKRFVDQGITINGIPIDVDYFYTDMPMQNTTLGVTNHIKLKVYENRGPYNIEMVQLGIGVKEIGTPINNAQARIEITIDNFSDDMKNPRMEGFEVIDSDKILNNTDVSVYLVPCGAVTSDCLGVDIQYAYVKPPQSPVLMVNSFDFARNSANSYFNDGLELVGIPEIIEHTEPYKYVCNDIPLNEIYGPVTRNNCHFRALADIWK